MNRVMLCVLAVGACSSSEPTSKVLAERPANSAAHEERNGPALASPPLKLDVRVDGAATTWAQDVFDRVAHHAATNKSGKARDTWSLRDSAHEMAGPNARVVAVIGTTKESITSDAWADVSRTPIVHRTGRGGLKFRWADANGTWDEANVGDVVGLEVVH